VRPSLIDYRLAEACPPCVIASAIIFLGTFRPAVGDAARGADGEHPEVASAQDRKIHLMNGVRGGGNLVRIGHEAFIGWAEGCGRGSYRALAKHQT